MTTALTHHIALLCEYPGGLEDEVIRGVIDYAHHHTAWKFAGHGHRPFLSFEQIDLNAVDGVIGFFIERAWADAVAAAGVRAVDTSEHHANLPSCARVTSDDFAAGRLGAEHLLGLGLNRFAFVTTGRYAFCMRRLEGFAQVMDDAGRGHEVWWIPPEHWEHRDEWLAECMQDMPTPIGIMAHADYIAATVVNAATAQGLRVPDDVAVVGVEHDLWASTVSDVPLSSVELDAHRVGHEAAKTMAGLMGGEAMQPPRYVPPRGVVQAASSDITHTQDPLVTRALQYMREHLGEGILVEDVVDAMEVSRPTLLKRVKRATGLTPHEALCRARVEECKRLLTHTDASIEQIAHRCGFRCPPRLNETFKRLTGTTPGTYRQRTARASR